MTTKARHDPVATRFVPDAELVARAQRAMMQDEEGNPRTRFTRQRWEEAFGAVRVALDALREIYPSEAGTLDDDLHEDLASALGSVTIAYTNLDDMSLALLGYPMHAVLQGQITTHAELDELGVAP